MEMSELSLKEMTLGQRMALAAQLAVARHWFNAESERREGQTNTETNPGIGGADRARIMDDPNE